MSVVLGAFADTNDSRTRLPRFFYNSSIGINLGYGKFAFTNSNLPPGYQAAKVENKRAVIGINLDHYFKPYLAAEISLMRPIQWVKYVNINNTVVRHSIWLSLFGLTLKPAWVISPKFKLYGKGGVGFISRHGFDINEIPLVKSQTLFAWIIGGGGEYRFAQHWSTDLNLTYSPSNHSKNQPYTLYTSAGVRYYILPPADDESRPTTSRYNFPVNMVHIGFMDKHFFNWDISKYFTPPYLPIFFDSPLRAQRGLMLSYERNFYHTQKRFSLDWGVSTGYWVSKEKEQSFYTVSLFPEFKFWVLRSKYVDGYFTYAIAGPTYMSRDTIDNHHMGSHFTFQDFIGVGCLCGKSKHIVLDLRLVHFSNGNMFPENPGFNVPVMLNAGITF